MGADGGAGGGAARSFARDVLRFDANLPALAAQLPVNPWRALARRAEYPEGSYAELRAAAAAYVGCSPDEVAVDAGADGLLYLVARTFLSKAFGLAGLRVGYAVTSAGVARELTARRSPAPIADVAAMLASAALRDPAPARAEATATREERARVRGALANAGHDVEPTHTNFIYVRTGDAAATSACLERKGLVVRAYADALRITLRSPGEDDLRLDALGTAGEPSLRRSVTVLAPHVRVSLTLDGSGRSSVRTGDDALDQELEGQAQVSGWDLELVADDDVGAETVLAALTEAEARASA